MRFFIKIFVVLLIPVSSGSQQSRIDSLRSVIHKQNGDQEEVNALAHLANELTNSDSAAIFARRGLALAKNINYEKGQADCLFVLAMINGRQANFSAGMQYALSSLNIYKKLRYPVGIASAHLALQGDYRTWGDFRNSLSNAFSALQISKAERIVGEFLFPHHRFEPLAYAEIGQTYLLMGQLDSALYFTEKATELKEPFNNSEWNFPVYLLATIQTMRGEYDAALKNYRRAVPLAIKNGFFRDTLQIFSGMSTLFKKMGEMDSAIFYASMVANSPNPELETKNLLEAVNNLAKIYKEVGIKDSAIRYIELHNILKDSILSNEKNLEIQSITFNERLKQQEMVASQLKYKSKVQLYALISGIVILLLVAALLWRNNLLKQKNKERIEKAYGELKNTQAQLIQSEKMASLGELTTGIAHEIQNPLNFVNNFSDINSELIDEAHHQIDKGNLKEARAILNDIRDNEQKISNHGKRADSIVKAMLQHSITSSGQKEPININALADEYLRLAYHGLRAKDKSFNAVTRTYFDNSIGKIDVVPQEIGRVILNLVNNAFYAVNEKRKQNLQDYEPTVTVITAKQNEKVEIRVRDNGNGIPQKILDKIFQPFFTTKPAGEGTGLGLSLAYDIVTKGHGGEIRVETKESGGSEFVITLPA